MHFRDGATGNRPQIQTGYAAIGAEPSAVFCKELPVDFPVVVEHPKATLNGEVIIAENIGPLHTEQQNHFSRPDTHTL